MSEEENVRWFTIDGPPKAIERYMGGAWKVVGYEEDGDTIHVFIEGFDLAGWTVDEWLRPRLESGLWFGLTELPLDPMDDNTVAHDGAKPWPEDD